MNQPTTLAEGRYLLVEPLGEGGMATVYRAFDQRLQVWRAVKILNPDYASKSKIRKRFEAEAQTMALLEHRNIVRVYDVGRDDNIAYIVMELLLGGCLVDWLEVHGPMPPRMAVDATIQTCEGLAHAHAKGVIHRDIKPHNVLVTADGVCRVTDFGIARVGDSEASMTKTGSVMGTWGYMAPEQRTNAKGVDVRADVYAVGATLYSLLTDRMPMDLFAAERDSSILEGVHELLVPVLVKSTEYSREDRYDTVVALADALRELRADLPEVPDDTPPLAISGEAETPAPPDAAAFEKAPKASDTILPASDTRMKADTDPSPTILPDGDETLILENTDEALAGPHAMTMPPEEVAVTEPGAVSRQSRPVFDPKSLAPTAVLDPPSQPPTEKPSGGSGVRAALAGATLMVWLLGGLVVILAAIAVIYVTVLAPGRTPDPEPVPVTPVQPEPPPDPVVPDPPPKPVQPTRPDPPPVPQPPPPGPVRPTQPVTQPTQPVTQPTQPAVPDPAPVASTCTKPSAARLNSQKNKILFMVSPCEGPANPELSLSVYYRVPGGRFQRRDMRIVSQKWRASLEVKPDYKERGIEYYIAGGDTPFGTESSPKTFVP